MEVADKTDRKRTVRVRVGQLDVDGARFDEEWWAAYSPSERVGMMWELVLEARRWRGEDGDEPRLQRSVLRVERR